MNNTFVYSTRSKTPLFPRSLDFVKRALFLQVFSRRINCLLPISSRPLGRLPYCWTCFPGELSLSIGSLVSTSWYYYMQCNYKCIHRITQAIDL